MLLSVRRHCLQSKYIIHSYYFLHWFSTWCDVGPTGDSRAVLATASGVIQLTEDHAPTVASEADRITACGGRVVDTGTGARVMGMLAMSRSIGNRWLRQFGVIAEPTVSVQPRMPDHEFVIVASDGLWGSVSNEDAVTVVRRTFERAGSKGASRLACARIAAKVLLRTAMIKGNTDNISIVVVDLASCPGVPAQPAHQPGLDHSHRDGIASCCASEAVKENQQLDRKEVAVTVGFGQAACALPEFVLQCRASSMAPAALDFQQSICRTASASSH